MRIGNNEKIILSLIKKYKKLDGRELQILFSIVASKKVILDTLLHSLRIKGIIDEQTGSIDFSILNDVKLEEIEIKQEILDNLDQVKVQVKLGKLSKSILYVLSKAEKCSLQFFSIFFKKPTKNMYAILQRLDEKKLVVSFNSRIKHLNTNGRRYNPKYYVLTDLGKIWLQVYLNDIPDKKKIDQLLEKPQEEINVLISKF